MSNVVELLRALVSISSISKESNRGVIDFAERLLSSLEWEFREEAYFDSAGVKKVNLIAWPTTQQASDQTFHLALVCHTDTVPYAASWPEAIALAERGENLHGCGACDVKGFFACILATASQLDLSGISKPLCIVLTADEEVGCVGVRTLVERQSLRAKFAIVGEPTSLQPMRAGKGYCLAEVSVGGREAHSAYPERGESAIFRAARLVVEIEKIAEQLKAHTAPGFSPPCTTLNVGEIQGGLAKNIVAPSCRFLLEWRPIPGQAPSLVPELIQKAAQALTQSDPGFVYELHIVREQEGFATEAGSQLLLSMCRQSGRDSGSVAFGTEAPWLNRLGAEAIVFGPGSMESAHSPREFVPRSELDRCVEILGEVIRELCGTGALD